MTLSVISRASQVRALLARAPAEKHVDATIDGLGTVRVDCVNGQRFVFVGTRAVSPQQLISSAKELDAGAKGHAQTDADFIASMNSRLGTVLL